MAKTNDWVLAVDQSTSATKVMIFTLEGELMDQEALSHRQFYPKQKWVEQDAEEIYENLLKASAILLKRHPEKIGCLRYLSITNQRETFLVFEKSSGRPLHPAIIWQCTRGESICEQLVKEGNETWVREKTGLKIDTYFPASKIQWLLQDNQGIKTEIENGNALISTIESYLIYRLTKRRVFASDPSNASRTLLFNIHSLHWDPELLNLFSIPVTALPEIRPCDARFGETDLEGLLPGPLPICGVMGDSQAALFAQRCFKPGTAKVTIGTGSSILLNIGNKPYLAGEGIMTALAWVVQDQPAFAFEGILNFTGATIQWLRDQLQLINSSEETQALAESVPDSAGVYMVPAFLGLSAPYWRTDIKAAIVGLTPDVTRAHVVRAALESIAYMINDVFVLLQNKSNISMKKIYADGGASRNRFLMQFLSDISGLSVQASHIAELSALGSVLAGALGMGFYQSVEDLESLPASYDIYHALLPQEKIETLLSGWKQSVQQILAK